MATIPEIPQLDVESSTPRSNTSLLTVVWQRKSLVILGIVVGLVAGTLFYAQRTPVFQSPASILIVKKHGAPTSGPGTVTASSIMMEDYMSTQKVLLGSQMIAEKTANCDKVKTRLEKDGFSAFPEAKKPEDLVSGIMTSLIVTRDNKDATQNAPGNNVIMLNFRCTNQEECKFILENLIEMYQRFIDDTYQDISESMFKEFARMRNELEQDIKRKEDAYEKFLNEAPIVVIKGSGGGKSALDKEAENYAELVAKLKVELKQKINTLDHLEKLKAEKGTAEVTQYIVHHLRKIGEVHDPEHERNLQQLRMTESRLLSAYGDNHPEVKGIRKQIAILESLHGGTAKTDPSNGNKESNGKAVDYSETYMKDLKNDIKITEGTLALFETEESKARKALRENQHWVNDEDKLRNAKERARLLFEQVNQKVEELKMRKDSGGFKAVPITRPGYGFKISPNPYQVFTAATLLGLLFGVGLAYLAEVSDKSFRNPTEIRKRLGLPVIGHIPFLAADEKAQQLVASGSNTVDPLLITHYQSNSVGAEAYRGVRTALYFSTQGAGHQVIQVTSPNVSDGKSTLAANLAVSIAQSGKRTLLIDCDFRKPRVHKIFNVPAQLGMASAMAGQSDLTSAIQPTAVPNLSVLPCGPRPVNPAELLTSPKFSELIEQLRAMYDFVIVDTPPILVVTDPAVVAPRVDGVVLCIRVTKNGRPYAERAREVLTSLGANILGVVVNGFGAQVGGGKYGYEHYNYGYGEGYSYTYGYSYGYADKEAASYYGNQPEEHAPAAKS